MAEPAKDRIRNNASEPLDRSCTDLRDEGLKAAKEATSVIPIVFAGAGDLVGSGLVANLARPGGNLTGLSIQSEVAAKRHEILREVPPDE